MVHAMAHNAGEYSFPPLDAATPEGLLAIGGDLSSGRLLAAYRRGIFPWYSAGQPILWWSPDPRTVLYPRQLTVRRSLRKSLRQRGFALTTDSAFTEVIDRCAEPRTSEAGTWITPQMRAAYTDLHRAGHAHSVETWQGDQLVGGLYGIAIGQAFFGESMFSRVTDASKAALVALARVLVDRGYRFIDCQVSSEHLLSLGARNIPRALFVRQLQQAVAADTNPEHWAVRFEGAELA